MSKPYVLSILAIALFLLLGFRLLQLQVLQHDKYSVLAKNNSTKVSIHRAPRGVIYDRKGKILATNKQSLSVVVYPSLLRSRKDQELVAQTLSSFLEVTSEDLTEIFKKMDPTTPLPLVVENDIKVEDAIRIIENQQSLPGISVEKQAIRYYPYEELGAHFLGYIGQVNSRELKNKSYKNLQLGDTIGKEGLEKTFDKSLRGINGEERVPVDRYGKTLEVDSIAQKTIKRAIRGQDLHLTIDIELQKVAEEAMGNMAGAVVAVNPQNGEIYALVSKPGFDPNIFTKPVPSKLYKRLLDTKAFLNRALSAYTPGSIWKPIAALAALENGVASRYETLAVSGAINLGGFIFGDWTSEKGYMNLVQAIAWSRDTYFYQVAKRMKPEWIAELGRQMGAGAKTNIELVGESKGIVPDPAWKEKNLKQPWFPGNTLHYSIGQSFLLVTPLQAASFTSGIATNGSIPQLHLIKDPEKEKPKETVAISKKSLNAVQEGMRLCVRDGTCVLSKIESVTVAGKTGSAEVHGYSHTTHGWFASYAPAGIDEVPEIVVIVFGEGAGHGGNVCAPVAKKIYEKFFESEESPEA